MASTPLDPTPAYPAAEAPPLPPEGIPIPPPPEPPPPKPAVWPAWFSATDGILAMLVVMLAFLAASYAVRNPDFWLHLANGRIITSGQFAPGTDPFSQAGEAGRPWVNWSWLSDVGIYAVYSANPAGSAVVAIKAGLVALAFAMLFLLRRPGSASWPWAVFVGLAVVASAPFLSARPFVASLLFLAATLVLLYRGPWTAGSWRGPIALAGLFALWANMDGWFFLGPVTVALILLGELLHPLLLGEDSANDSAADVFYPAPRASQLVQALLLGVVACLLNPTFLAALAKDPAEAVAQILPIELGGVPSEASVDPELSVLTLTPLAEGVYVSRSGEPQLYGLAFATLMVLGGLVLAGGYARLRATHILLWVGFAALAFQHVRLIAMFAVVAAPLAAGHANGLSTRAVLGPWADLRTRVLLLGSGLGRVLSVIAIVLLLGAAYPGWIHPIPQPLAWTLEPDAGLVRAAQHVDRWRTNGVMPESFRGLNAAPEFGDLCAWYAPNERVFVDSRYRYHRAELHDMFAVRRAVFPRRGSDTPPDFNSVWEACDRHRLEYLTIATRGPRQVDPNIPLALVYESNQWALWHIDGRFAALGRLAAQERDPAAFRRMAFDPAAMAFGTLARPVPDGEVVPIPPSEREFLDEYLTRTVPVPPEVDDVDTWARYAEVLGQVANFRRQVAVQNEYFSRSAVAGSAIAHFARSHRPTVGADELALPVIMVRAARRAVAAAPDRPEGYRALATAYRHPLAPVSHQQDQQSQIVTARARFLARLPKPTQSNPGAAYLAAEEARLLAEALYNSGQLDLARDALRTAIAYAQVVPPELFPARRQATGSQSEDPRAQYLAELTKSEQRLADQVAGAKNQMQRVTDRTQRFYASAQSGLPGDAIEQFKSAANPEEVFGANALAVRLATVELELNAGRLEAATEDLIAAQAATQQQVDGGVRDAVTQFAVVKVETLGAMISRLSGDTTAAIEFATSRAAATLAKLTPAQLALVGRDLTLPPLGVGGITGPAPLLPFGLFPVLGVSQVLRQEASFNIDRGLLALEAGDVAKAGSWFGQSAVSQGVPLSRLLTSAHLTLLLTVQALNADPRVPPQRQEAEQREQASRFEELAHTAGLAERYAELIRKYDK